MAYSYAEIRSFQGLYLQQNSFQVPDGAMEEAKNIVIKSDDVITKTNGFYNFWEASPFELATYGVPRATVNFQNTIILFSAQGVGYFQETFPYGVQFNTSGTLYPNNAQGTTYTNVSSFERNNNLYFTSDQGIRKLETFAGAASRAGVPPGLTLRAVRILYANDGYIKSTNTGAQVAYRLVFGRRDTNGNLLLSAPSDIVTVGIPANTLLVNYTIKSGIAEVDYPLDPYLSPTVNSFVISDSTNPALDGPQDYFPGDPSKLSFATAEPDGSGTFTVSFAGAIVDVQFEFPSELEGPGYEYFYQLYRTSPSPSVTASPVPDFRLATEKTLTEKNYGDRTVTIVDTVPDALLMAGAELYTNPTTAEGELKENTRPPYAEFADFYKNHAMYSATQTVQRMLLNMVNPEELIGIDLIFKVGPTQEVYRGVNDSVYLPGNVNTFTPTIFGTNPLQISVPLSTNFPIGSKVLISGVVGGTIIPGEYTMTALAAGIATINVMGNAAFVDAQFVSDGTARLYNGYNATYDNNGNSAFRTTAQWAAYVAQDLCRAINLNYDSFMYANYRSGFDEFPGKFTIQSKKFIDPIYLRYSAEPDAPPFVQNIPFSFGDGIQFYSDNDIKPHWVQVSKPGEPEACPVLDYIPVGSSTYRICGTAATRDSFIVLKEDGAYRIRGDTFENMTLEPLDLTVKFIYGMKCVLGTINNTIIAFSNQGIVQITDTSVQLISRRIEDVIQPLIGRDLSSTFLFGHEADRLFFVSTANINPGQARKCWVYNVLNQTWTEIDKVFDHMALDSKNAMLGITADFINSKYVLWRQRRSNTRIDWCGEWAYGSIDTDTTIYPDKLTGTFSISGGNDVIPEKGDVILAGNIFNRIVDVSELGGIYTITFAQPVSYAENTPVDVFLYKGYESTIKFSPFHAGFVGRLKHFAQMQIHMRQQVITDLLLDYSTGYFNGSDTAEWKAQNLATVGAMGWGFSPWGQFPWGLTAGANLKAGTEAAAIIRTLVPRFAARATFICPRFRHSQAGQPMYIQALSWSIHTSKERVSK